MRAAVAGASVSVPDVLHGLRTSFVPMAEEVTLPLSHAAAPASVAARTKKRTMGARYRFIKGILEKFSARTGTCCV
jgi:hypothetical protein